MKTKNEKDDNEHEN